MTDTTTAPTAEDLAAKRAEVLRLLDAASDLAREVLDHTPYDRGGRNWRSVLDPIASAASAMEAIDRQNAPAPAPAPLVEYVVLVDLGEDVAEVRVEALDPADARLVAVEQARNNGYDDAEAVSVEVAGSDR